MRSTLAAAIRLAFRENRFLEAASLIREIPATMRSFKHQKIKRPSKYLPSACGLSLVKNPAIAAQMNSMHDRWYGSEREFLKRCDEYAVKRAVESGEPANDDERTARLLASGQKTFALEGPEA